MPDSYALLLPWYLSGTLSARETALVAAELASSPALAVELSELTQLRRLMRTVGAATPQPDPGLFERVLARTVEARGGIADGCD